MEAKVTFQTTDVKRDSVWGSFWDEFDKKACLTSQMGRQSTAIVSTLDAKILLAKFREYNETMEVSSDDPGVEYLQGKSIKVLRNQLTKINSFHPIALLLLTGCITTKTRSRHKGSDDPSSPRRRLSSLKQRERAMSGEIEAKSLSLRNYASEPKVRARESSISLYRRESDLLSLPDLTTQAGHYRASISLAPSETLYSEEMDESQLHWVFSSSPKISTHASDESFSFHHHHTKAPTYKSSVSGLDDIDVDFVSF